METKYVSLASPWSDFSEYFEELENAQSDKLVQEIYTSAVNCERFEMKFKLNIQDKKQKAIQEFTEANLQYINWASSTLQEAQLLACEISRPKEKRVQSTFSKEVWSTYKLVYDNFLNEVEVAANRAIKRFSCILEEVVFDYTYESLACVKEGSKRTIVEFEEKVRSVQQELSNDFLQSVQELLSWAVSSLIQKLTAVVRLHQSEDIVVPGSILQLLELSCN